MLSHPPPELWVEDGSVLWVGQHHETVIGELLGDQGLVAFADVELVDVSLDEGLKGLWAQERVCLRNVESCTIAGRHLRGWCEGSVSDGIKS